MKSKHLNNAGHTVTAHRDQKSPDGKTRLYCIVIALILLTGGCSEDTTTPPTVQKLEWPAWSADGNYVATRILQPEDGQSYSTRFLIKDILHDTAWTILIPAPNNTEPTQFFFAPDRPALFVGNNGFAVYDIAGRPVNERLSSSDGSYIPQALAFSKDSSGYYSAKIEGSLLRVCYTSTYNPATYVPDDCTTMVSDTMVDGFITGLIETGKGMCAIRLSSGNIILAGIDASRPVRTFRIQSPAATTPIPWTLGFLKSADGSSSSTKPDFLYYQTGASVVRLNMQNETIETVVSGGAKCFDVNIPTRSIAVSTIGSNVHLLSENGTSIQKLLSYAQMGRLSKDGKSVAGVSIWESTADSILVLRFRY